MKSKIIVLLTSLFTFLSFAQDQTAYEYNEIKIKKGVELIDDSTFAIESVAVSNDGNKLCWIGKTSSKSYVFPGDILLKEKVNGEWQKSSKHNKKLKKMNLFSKCTFNENEELVASELGWRPGSIIKSIIKKKKTGEFISTGYASMINTYDGAKRVQKINAKDLGHIKNTEFIKHPKISPDGKWLTYYTTGMFDQKGAFLVNLKTMKNYRLSDVYDKHPTFSPDGTKVLFHHDPEREGAEQAYLGYFDLTIKDDKLIAADRVMLDDVNKSGYVYHKHPAMYADTDLLFFHAQTKVDGKKKLMVRRLAKESAIYEVEMKVGDEKIHKAKHPATAVNESGVFFVGKFKDDKDYKVFQISPESILKLDSQL